VTIVASRQRHEFRVVRSSWGLAVDLTGHVRVNDQVGPELSE
jgi:hypothetical protein